MRRRRFALLVVPIALLIVAVGTAAWLLRDPNPRFLERRSAIASVREGETIVEDGFSLQEMRVVGTSGLTVDLVVRRAIADSGQTLPLALILGGHHTGRDAARLLGDTRGVIVAALSYPFTGDPRPDAVTFLRDIPKIRAAFLDTPPAVMLALDHLRQLPGVDDARVEMIGVSLGGPFASIAGALDPRISRVWVLHGSGGSFVPLEANMRRTIAVAPLRLAAAGLANVIIAGPRLDPVHWVGRIAPRQFVMVNAADDERMPRGAVDALFAAASSPKEQLWMPGGHVHADRATIQRLVEVVMARVRSTPGAEGGDAAR